MVWVLRDLHSPALIWSCATLKIFIHIHYYHHRNPWQHQTPFLYIHTYIATILLIILLPAKTKGIQSSPPSRSYATFWSHFKNKFGQSTMYPLLKHKLERWVTVTVYWNSLPNQPSILWSMLHPMHFYYSRVWFMQTAIDRVEVSYCNSNQIWFIQIHLSS